MSEFEFDNWDAYETNENPFTEALLDFYSDREDFTEAFEDFYEDVC